MKNEYFDSMIESENEILQEDGDEEKHEKDAKEHNKESVEIFDIEFYTEIFTEIISETNNQLISYVSKIRKKPIDKDYNMTESEKAASKQAVKLYLSKITDSKKLDYIIYFNFLKIIAGKWFDYFLTPETPEYENKLKDTITPRNQEYKSKETNTITPRSPGPENKKGSEKIKGVSNIIKFTKDENTGN
jgi:hypothetical protein